MIPFHEAMSEYRSQMEHGVIRQAYRGLMEYMMDLRVGGRTERLMRPD